MALGSDVTVRIDGLRELGARFKSLKDDMQRKAAWSATGRGAAVVKKAAKSIIAGQSYESGSLLDAVVSKRVPSGQRQYTAEHWVTVRRRKSGKKAKGKQPTAPHAGFVEFGTVKMQAEPYLRPALANNISRIGEEMRKKLAKSIDKYAAK